MSHVLIHIIYVEKFFSKVCTVVRSTLEINAVEYYTEKNISLSTPWCSH